MNGNKPNVLRALADFLGGVTHVDNAANPGSAHSRVMRATEDKKKGPAKGPFNAEPVADRPLASVKKKIPLMGK